MTIGRPATACSVVVLKAKSLTASSSTCGGPAASADAGDGGCDATDAAGAAGASDPTDVGWQATRTASTIAVATRIPASWTARRPMPSLYADAIPMPITLAACGGADTASVADGAPDTRPDRLTLAAFLAVAVIGGGNGIAVKQSVAELAPF